MTLDLQRPLLASIATEFMVYNLSGGGTHPIHGAFWSKMHEQWISDQWDMEGNPLRGPVSIANERRRFRVEQWANVYHYPNSGPTEAFFHDTREDADTEAATKVRVACVKVIVEASEGEGLS